MPDRDGFELCLCGDTVVTQTFGTPPPPAFVSVRPLTGTVESELGQDLDVVVDLDPQFRLALGKPNLANAIARRLITPGGFLYDAFRGEANYGRDIRGKLNVGFTLAEIGEIEDAIKAEVMRDDRVQDADVTVNFSLATSTLDVTIALQTAVGPFPLAIRVTDVTIDILEVG